MNTIATIALSDEPGLIASARTLIPARGRRILGIAGPPGAGKSTLASRLVEALGDDAVILVPMDGFHLADSELARLRRQGRKGAPDTFDGAGYRVMLKRLRDEVDSVVYAPIFRRDLDEPISGAIGVVPHHRLVITEGNYLLIDRPPFERISELLDEKWYLDLDDEMRQDRLIRRHEQFGRSRVDAEAFVFSSDARNAKLVSPSRERADLIVDAGA